jgi:hypothetical protein
MVFVKIINAFVKRIISESIARLNVVNGIAMIEVYVILIMEHVHVIQAFMVIIVNIKTVLMIVQGH